MAKNATRFSIQPNITFLKTANIHSPCLGVQNSLKNTLTSEQKDVGSMLS